MTSWRRDVTKICFGHCGRIFWPICFKFGGNMPMAYPHRIMWKKRHDVTTSRRYYVKTSILGGFLAPAAMFFDWFGSNFVETCTLYSRIVWCDIWRHDVTTSRHIYNRINFFVSQPISFKFSQVLDIPRVRVVGGLIFWILMLVGNERAIFD